MSTCAEDSDFLSRLSRPWSPTKSPIPWSVISQRSSLHLYAPDLQEGSGQSCSASSLNFSSKMKDVYRREWWHAKTILFKVHSWQRWLAAVSGTKHRRIWAAKLRRKGTFLQIKNNGFGLLKKELNRESAKIQIQHRKGSALGPRSDSWVALRHIVDDIYSGYCFM